MQLIRRLAPAAFLVLALVVVAAALILPKLHWLETGDEILAAALYFENWQLAANAVDYLARENPPSPVQHYWALSIQGQIYVLWPLLMAAVFMLSRFAGASSRRLLLMVTLVALAISFAYSVYATDVDQAWAYFDSFARFWEFCLGALLAILALRPVLPPLLAAVLGWLGLAAIVSCGVVFQAADSFPGFAALWPTIAAAVLLTVGAGGGRFGVHRLLASRPMVALGGISYHLYLWHWPILIFLLVLKGSNHPTAIEGFLIIAAAMGLSFLTTAFVEKPIRQRQVFSNASVLAVAAGCILVLASLHLWLGQTINRELESFVAGAGNYPGAISRMEGNGSMSIAVDFPLMPSPLSARSDVPKSYRDKCHQTITAEEPKSCEYGTLDDPAAVIVLVGGSHSAQFLPALEAFAERRRWKIVSLTKSSCRWEADAPSYADPSCIAWNRLVTPEIVALRPDLVITTSNIRLQPEVPKGFVAQWRKVTAAGIPVMAIRDTPFFSFDVPKCVEQHGPDASVCSMLRIDAYNGVLPENTLPEKPEKVTFVDLSHYFCDDDRCRPAYGNVLVYRDREHITASYEATLAPVLGERMEEILKGG